MEEQCESSQLQSTDPIDEETEPAAIEKAETSDMIAAMARKRYIGCGAKGSRPVRKHGGPSRRM